MILGINGLGRVGKLSLWEQVFRRHFKEIVVNVGREVGTSLTDIAHYIERDSTYGRMHNYLRGCSAQPMISDINEDGSYMLIDGMPVRFLRTARNPAEIGWGKHSARLVVDTTGQFVNPLHSEDHSEGSLRGHLKSGAERVIVSAPFKIKDGQEMPGDVVTTVMGVNDSDYDPRRHYIISNASCTTTCLAHMFKPLLDRLGASRVLSASMATVHAVTGSQEVLDRLPRAGKTDLRKSRSVMNNIILTTTGAAKALALILPEMQQIGFIAESVRVPISTGSLIILVLSLQEGNGQELIRSKEINEIYRQAAAANPKGYLNFTREQNVSGDIIGNPQAAVIIEGHETHTRTAETQLDLAKVPHFPQEALAALEGNTTINYRGTQAVIYGWYDNEMGCYVKMLGDRTISIAEQM